MQGVDKVKILEREEIIDILTKKLPILRASIGISQTELSEYIGISRQTYNTFETGKRKMSWSIFLTLFLFFISNTSSYELLKTEKGYVLGTGVINGGMLKNMYPKGWRRLI